MPINIPKDGSVDGFAMIVDINGFTTMVEKDEDQNIARFTSDILTARIEIVERCGGVVVGFMGDAFLAIFDSAEEVIKCCISIAISVDKTSQYISRIQATDKDFHPYARGGVSLKIGVEYGTMDIEEIQSEFLGVQKLFIGTAVNHASRILRAGVGNRCLIGPKAMLKGLDEINHKGPYEIKGKKGEGNYTYFELDLDETW